GGPRGALRGSLRPPGWSQTQCTPGFWDQPLREERSIDERSDASHDPFPSSQEAPPQRHPPRAGASPFAERALGSAGERFGLEQRPEAGRFEEVSAAAVRQTQLAEDRHRLRISSRGRLAPFACQPLAQLEVARSCREDTPNDELRGDCPVPPILFEPKADVVERVGA